MQIVSLIWGVLAFIGFVISFLPCIQPLNWVIAPFAGVGVLISAIAIARKSPDNAVSIAGLACNIVAFVIGLLRIYIGYTPI